MSESSAKARVDGADLNPGALALVTAFAAAGLEVLALANAGAKKQVTPGFETVISADGVFFTLSIRAMPDDYKPDAGVKPGPETVTGPAEEEITSHTSASAMNPTEKRLTEQLGAAAVALYLHQAAEAKRQGRQVPQVVTAGLRGEMPCVRLKVRIETSHDATLCRHPTTGATHAS